MSERREIAQLTPLDYFNVLAKNQEDAEISMIGYYAALQSNDLQRHYRNFYVVHPEPGANCAQQWKDTIHNISDVITPERCAEELEKPSKDSLFDFREWAMELKEKGDDASARSDDGSMGDAPMDISPVKSKKEARHAS
jgi:chromo domain-containing protein 1